MSFITFNQSIILLNRHVNGIQWNLENCHSELNDDWLLMQLKCAQMFGIHSSIPVCIMYTIYDIHFSHFMNGFQAYISFDFF